MGLFSWFFGRKASPPVNEADDEPSRWAPPPRLSSQGIARRPAAGRFGKARHKPAGEWVQTTMMVRVAGVTYRHGAAASFAAAVQLAEQTARPYGVRLRPDPDNPADPNAIAVDGFAAGESWHVGFLDRDTAEEITRDLVKSGVPIAAELYEIWLGDDGFIDIKIIVLAPPGHSLKSRLKRQ